MGEFLPDFSLITKPKGKPYTRQGRELAGSYLASTSLESTVAAHLGWAVTSECQTVTSPVRTYFLC